MADQGAPITSPGKGAFVIIAGSPLQQPTRAIYCDVGGSATLIFSDGSQIAPNHLQAGMLYPFQIIAVTAGATATLFGIY